MTKTSHSYFVVMRECGRHGLEANVHPEDTRRSIVAMIKSGELNNIAFIHHIDGLYVEDVTGEIMGEAAHLAIDAVLA